MRAERNRLAGENARLRAQVDQTAAALRTQYLEVVRARDAIAASFPDSSDVTSS